MTLLQQLIVIFMMVACRKSVDALPTPEEAFKMYAHKGSWETLVENRNSQIYRVTMPNGEHHVIKIASPKSSHVFKTPPYGQQGASRPYMVLPTEEPPTAEIGVLKQLWSDPQVKEESRQHFIEYRGSWLGLDRWGKMKGFMVLEYCNGGTLTKYPRRAPFPQKLQLFRDFLHAVNALHQAGYCHMDIKPDNICMIISGSILKIKMMDFDSAAQINIVAHPTIPVIRSTIGFRGAEFIDEAFWNGAAPFDCRFADAFSAAATLYDVLISSKFVDIMEDWDKTVAAARASALSASMYLAARDGGLNEEKLKQASKREYTQRMNKIRNDFEPKLSLAADAGTIAGVLRAGLEANERALNAKATEIKCISNVLSQMLHMDITKRLGIADAIEHLNKNCKDLEGNAAVVTRKRPDDSKEGPQVLQPPNKPAAEKHATDAATDGAKPADRERPVLYLGGMRLA